MRGTQETEERRTSVAANGTTQGAALPQFVRDMLASPPRRGEGLNLWLYRAARVLHAFRTETEIRDLLLASTAGEPVKHTEVIRAVARSEAHAWQPGNSNHSAPALTANMWPCLNTAYRNRILASGHGLVDLWERSAVHFDDNEPHTEAIIDILFPGNPLLCVGKSSYQFATRPRETWRGRLSEMQLIVPSPMSARTGLTQEGRTSEHSLANTGPRRFLVVEQDNGTEDEQAAILLHLADFAPLVMAVHSGGKSIHGWFLAAGESDQTLKEFMQHAVSLGADRALWLRSQFVRMPDATRDNGRRQTVFYLNTNTL